MDTKGTCTVCGKALTPGAPEGLCPECLLKAGLGTGVDIGADTGKAPRFVPPKIEELAAKFPQLEILEFIGQGGMGAVYKARQKLLDRVVALKILPPQSGGPAFAERFTREARALARLNHPHIVTLYEFGQADGLFYFLMEFVNGVNLRLLLSNSRISSREALAIVPQICEALQFAHDSGIVHRDIKPENILLDKKGQVKIADFGVAKMIAESLTEASEEPATTAGELTEAGSTLGTLQYMAPEQIKNSAEVDHRADIYSLGVVFYQMLTGELPSGKIEPPSRKVIIDVRLDKVVLRALEKEPQHRYQHVNEMGTAVETISANSANPPPGKERLKIMSWTKTKIAIAGVAITLLGIGAAIIVMHVTASRTQTPLPDEFSIQPPSPEVSANAAAFSGAWVGNWGHELAGALIVEDVSSNGAVHVIYSWGNYTWFKAGWARETGIISNDVLRLDASYGPKISYILKPGGTLSGTYQMGNMPPTPGTMYRVESTNPAAIRRAAEKIDLSR
ncbi:MAG TPA: serine/threonine-protein kinase [Pseudomonadales bacterium]|nr:serine/threonine-protein kinase [Pseudomonadales bacterium]